MKGKLSSKITPYLLMAALAAWVLVLYARSWSYPYILLDDQEYLVNNQRIAAGLSLTNIRWAFSTFYMANWHPLTWMSYLTDMSLFGQQPGMQHAVNSLLHALSTGLLFLALYRLTGAQGKSLAVAALFGMHPQHVESVAWISERKDVLSGFFFMLTLLSYERYARRGSNVHYAMVLLFFALGLMSKPMLMTVPFLLLLLDVWPLGRTASVVGLPQNGRPWRPLVREKIPLVVLSLLSVAITYFAQDRSGAVVSVEVIPPLQRVMNAVVSYATYILHMVWPFNLAVYYPYSASGLPWWAFGGSLCLLVLMTVIAVRAFRARPYLLVCWLWYLGMLVPVIGLIQVGGQAMADRYAYLPLIGMYILVLWSAADLFPATGSLRTGVKTVLFLAAFLMVSAITYRQIGYWSDSIILYEHAQRVTPDNNTIRRFLGNAYLQRGNYGDSLEQYRRAVLMDPDDAESYNGMGMAMAFQGHAAEAADFYQKAIAKKPEYIKSYNNYGLLLLQLNRYDDALKIFQEALRFKNRDSDTHYNIGNAYAGMGRLEDAIAHFKLSLLYNPASPDACVNMANALFRLGRKAEAAAYYREALRIQPDYGLAQRNLNLLLEKR
ncbi:MAG: tetratricopeptide repeat protein [Nitrospiraceae bacterium]|nr:tetratricopeptide repeat protein [Nitrospiraceae bacterium]